MRRIVSMLITAVMLILCFGGEAIAQEGAIIAAKPVISKAGGVINEMPSQSNISDVSTVVYNRGNAKKNVTLRVDIYDGENIVKERRAEIEVKGGERKQIGMSVSLGNAQTIKAAVTDTDLGDEFEYTDYDFENDVNISIRENAFSIYENIYFDINRPVEKLDGLTVSTGNRNIPISVTAENMGSGITRFYLEFESNLKVDTSYKINTGAACDIFGGRLEPQIFYFNTREENDEFYAYQESKVITQRGVGGFSMLVYCNSQDKLKVFAKRKLSGINSSRFKTLTKLKIIDPNGKIGGQYDFSEQETALAEATVDIPYAAEGVWQLQFIGGNEGDILGIGVNKAEAWGVRGECVTGITQNTLLNGYVYIPSKCKKLYMAATAETTDIKLYDTDGNQVGETQSAASGIVKKSAESEVLSDSVYNIRINGNSGGFIIDIAPSLICPTAEMAQRLKGGWLECDGILVQGAMQRNIRKEMERLSDTKSFDVTYTKPQKPAEFQYPIAEAQLFGKGGVVSSVKNMLNIQNLNVNSPYFGEFKPDDTETWESGEISNAPCSMGYTSAITVDSEYNVFYQNQEMINRNAIYLLNKLMSLSEDLLVRDNATAETVPTTHGMFYHNYLAAMYYEMRDLLDDETVEVTDSIMLAMTEKMSNCIGNGPTNQWMFETKSIAAVYAALNDKTLERCLLNHVRAITEPNIGLGQCSAGYFMENGGYDGDYHSLNQNLVFGMYKILKESNACDEAVKILKNIIRSNLDFCSMLWIKEYGNIAPANNVCSRMSGGITSMTQLSIPLVIDEFPLAKSRMNLIRLPDTGAGSAATFPFLVNSKEYAMRLINKYWNSYDESFNLTSAGNDRIYYDIAKNYESYESAVIPSETESGIWEKSGIITVKHKGLYLISMYANSDNKAVPSGAYMGGGITQMSGDDTGSFIVSRKPNGEALNNAVFGTLNDGTLYISGKEKAVLNWIEKDKIFEISGSYNGIKTTWRYELTEKGVSVTVSADGDISDTYVNIPIPNSLTNAVLENGVLKYTYGDTSIKIIPHGDTELIKGTDGYDRMHIKCEGSVSYDIERVNDTVPSFDIEAQYSTSLAEAIENGNITVDASVLNTTGRAVNGTVLFAVFDADKKPIGCTYMKAHFDKDEVQKFKSKLNIPENAEEIKIYVCDDIKTVDDLKSNCVVLR